MSNKAGRGSDQFMLRLPEGMRDRIKFAADSNGRSMNAEIVSALEAAYPQETEIARLTRELHEAVRALDQANSDAERKKLKASVQDLSDQLKDAVIYQIQSI